VAAFDVVAIGEPLYELNRQPAGYFLPGFGGDTLNVAIAAARLGSRCAYITRLGADIFADEIGEVMRREGIVMTGVRRDAAAPTGLYFVTHGPQGHVFTYRRQGSAASLMTPADLDPALIAWLMPEACRKPEDAISAGSRSAGVIRLAAEPWRR
jgi:2-dehydro-3-deoxygluconokinase